MQEYNRFLSKVKRVIIPIPDFKFFHRASQDGDVDTKFVGRNNISSLLENWLRVPQNSKDQHKNKTADCTGSYLITGYRGMGKTSFVGKVIDKLEKEQENKWYIYNSKPSSKLLLSVWCMLPIVLLPSAYYILNHFSATSEYTLPCTLIISTVGSFFKCLRSFVI